MNRDETLTQAGALINGQRMQDYGDPAKNFADIAKLWSPILGRDIHPWQVALCMAQLKIARIFKTPNHEDSWVDGVGYLALGSELAAVPGEPSEITLMKSGTGDTLAWLQPPLRTLRVGDEVKGDTYEALPVGTFVNDPDDPDEGPLTRRENGLWSKNAGERGERRSWPRVIVSLPEDSEPLRVLDGNREVRA